MPDVQMGGGFASGYLDTSKALVDISNAQLLGQMNRFKLSQDIINANILAKARQDLVSHAGESYTNTTGFSPPGTPPQMPGPAPMAGPAEAPQMPGWAAEASQPAASGGSTISNPPSSSGGMGSLGVTAAPQAAPSPASTPAPVATTKPQAPANAPVSSRMETMASRNLATLQAQYMNLNAELYRASSVGDINRADVLRKEALTVQEKLNQAQNEDRKERKEMFDNTANALGNASDKSSLNTIIKGLDAKYGNIGTLTGAIGLVKDADGQYAWGGSDNPTKLAAFGSQLLTAKDRLDMALRQDEQRRRQDALDEQVRENKARDADRAVNEGIRQDGLELRKMLAPAMLDLAKNRFNEKMTNDARTQLNKDAVYAMYPRAEMTMSIADGYRQRLLAGDPNLTPSDANALEAQYKNLVEGFRPQVGGKFSAQEMNSFNGLFQKFQKWRTTIGSGTPALAKSTALEVANTMQDVNDIINNHAVVASLEATDKLQRQGVPPTGITFRGDINRLAATGNAKIVNDNGVEYVVVKDNTGKERKFLKPEGM